MRKRDSINQVSFVLYLLAWLVFYIIAVTAAIFLASCARVPGDPFALSRPVELHAVCLRLVDSDGHVYERTGWFTHDALSHALRFPGAREGGCWRDEPHEVPKAEKPKEEEKPPCLSRRCNPNG